MSEQKTIQVVPYDPNWPHMYEKEAALITKALGDNYVAIHHIGSTAVPGLSAKPKIDMIAVVKNGPRSIQQLEAAGFTYKGEWNIPLKFGFSKRGTTQVNLHIFEEHHPEIEANLVFRDYLRSHPESKIDYAKLKEELLLDTSSHERSSSRFPHYTLRKGDFIRKILRAAGFSRMRILKCSDETEWKAVKDFRDKYFFDPQGIQDPYTWTFHHAEHTHLLLYQGADSIGYAHIQFWPESRSALRIIVIDAAKHNQSLGSQFLGFIEKWLKTLGIKSIHVESRPKTLSFYLKNGYTSMPFEAVTSLDQASPKERSAQVSSNISKDIPLGKIL